MNINNAVVKDYEGKSLKEIAAAPVQALQGVSENDAKLLDEAFGVKTVADLGALKFAHWAYAISILSETEG